VAFVNNETSPRFERPEANGFVGGGGEEQSGGSGRNRCICVVWTRDRRRERDTIDGSRVTDETARGCRCGIGRDYGWERIAMEVPNANV
jgi:hypothetical protein